MGENVYLFQTYWRRAAESPSLFLQQLRWPERVCGLIEFVGESKVVRFPTAQKLKRLSEHKRRKRIVGLKQGQRKARKKEEKQEEPSFSRMLLPDLFYFPENEG